MFLWPKCGMFLSGQFGYLTQVQLIMCFVFWGEKWCPKTKQKRIKRQMTIRSFCNTLHETIDQIWFLSSSLIWSPKYFGLLKNENEIHLIFGCYGVISNLMCWEVSPHPSRCCPLELLCFASILQSINNGSINQLNHLINNDMKLTTDHPAKGSVNMNPTSASAVTSSSLNLSISQNSGEHP